MIPQIQGRCDRPIVLSGYAQDFVSPIAEIQFSCDGGETWTSYATENTDTLRNVNWEFSYIPPVPGVYELMVRAVRHDGVVTGTPARATLVVE